MQKDIQIPKFVSVVSIILGCLDLIRGFMHTVLIQFAATNIAGLDLTTSQAGDLLQLMGAFGMSNYLTGVMLILLGWKARHLALTMLGVIPVVYILGGVIVRVNASGYETSQAAWGGIPLMTVYLAVSGITCILGLWLSRK